MEAPKMKLSILAAFDDLQRQINFVTNSWCNCCEEVIPRILSEFEELRDRHLEAVAECRRLQASLEASNHDIKGLTSQLQNAQSMLDQAMKHRKRAEADSLSMVRQLALLKDILLNDNRNKLHEDTKEKIASLNRHKRDSERFSAQFDQNNMEYPNPNDRLKPITELDATSSLLSEMSYSRSEDDLDLSQSMINIRRWEKRQSGDPQDLPNPKKRRSSNRINAKKLFVGAKDDVIATATVTVTREGGGTAEAKIESIPRIVPSFKSSQAIPSAPPISSITDSTTTDTSSSNNAKWTAPMPPPSSLTKPSSDVSPGFGMGRKNVNLRPHAFVRKTCLTPEPCIFCGERLKFAKIMSRCQDCRSLCHVKCESKLPLPCVPCGNIHNLKEATIADYTPMTSPMVPAIIVHCIREIESRGMGEVGIYRLPGGDHDVQELKKTFLRGRGVPNLSNVNVHVLCGVVKNFLRSLREPLVLRTYWHDFVRATELSDPDDARAALYQAISELPQPNRDTLAALILHLQHVADCPETKMPISNLAKVFGPTLIGYSTNEPDPQTMLDETTKQLKVVDHLLRLPSDYWANFAYPTGTENKDPEYFPRTPSTPSLLAGAKNFLGGSTPRSLKTKKFFATPPTVKRA